MREFTFNGKTYSAENNDFWRLCQVIPGMSRADEMRAELHAYNLAEIKMFAKAASVSTKGVRNRKNNIVEAIISHCGGL